MEGGMLKKYRLLNGYSQQGIAKEMKISQQRLAAIEKKEKVSSNTLNKYLRAMEKNWQEWERFVQFFMQGK